jgi:hypothetical protein
MKKLKKNIKTYHPYVKIYIDCKYKHNYEIILKVQKLFTLKIYIRNLQKSYSKLISFQTITSFYFTANVI